LSMLAPRISGGLLAGVDPSALMVRQARGRLRPFEKEVRLELRQGTDRDIEWPAACFDNRSQSVGRPNIREGGGDPESCAYGV
jgi:hypothetical protein